MKALPVVSAIVLLVVGASAALATPPQVTKPTLQLKASPAPTATPTLYPVLDFDILTGSDNLRDDSEANAEVWFSDGTQDRCALKVQGEGEWASRSDHHAFCHLSRRRSVAELKSAWIWIALRSHPGFGESPDNWNINDVHVLADQIGVPLHGPPPCVFGASGNPLVRLTESRPRIRINTTPSSC